MTEIREVQKKLQILVSSLMENPMVGSGRDLPCDDITA